jgi:uncharacterized protein
MKLRGRQPNRRCKTISLDITPQVADSRILLQGYGDGGFRISGAGRLEGSQILFPEKVIPWKAKSFKDINLNSLGPIITEAERIKILIVGCGNEFSPIPDILRNGLKEQGIVLEWMDTGAACRTFNVLTVEERPVAAALIAVE